jgi:phytoene/squalene synthetase
MDKIAYYQGHLNRVSRSFAFCIAKLDGDLREWVSLSYLLCRILDTIEDAPWGDSSRQSEAFDGFQSFLFQAPSREEIQSWISLFPNEIDAGERQLLEDSRMSFELLDSLPLSVKERIRRPILNMYRGMRHFLEVKKERGQLRLQSLAEVNQYCFFVAGLVGELLTDLVREKWPKQVFHSNHLTDAHHFGLFLQKVNLLKDQAKDEKEGRFLVHSRQEVMASLVKDAEGAIRYLQSLPLAEKGFRTFCAWSLFLGLASLPWIEQSSLLGKFLKIPRVATELLMNQIENIIDDNQALLKMFLEMMPKIRKLDLKINPSDSNWIFSIYNGSLSREDFVKLGMSSPA